ncbi:nicotinamide riboside transporter PnuC [Rhodocytophaga aerolata]|uniref:Nicotinamide riboside transporter PnuC n=1 Tax=Rhodocytophaga aerolata TaxID=455078 RepID=A0ABT8R0E7_9BACT|nr:nicotinamide riboside transporter PnuC [Rhodocytophaga aerolata]MDO1444733.1 nicotinamide riboside transporter PnuC [Rhodocytophaga aerolata]
MEEIIHYIGQNWLEIAGVITGFICVYLNAKENIWGWPLGIISCFLYIFIMYNARFYADMWLQVVYVFLNAYGWYQWLYGGENQTELKVTNASRQQLGVLLPVGVLATGAAYYYFSTFTDAAQPFWDSFNTAFSLVAVYLQAKKKLESWILWIMVDIIYIPLFFFRGLHLTSLLYIAYLVLATMGYILWRRSMLQSREGVKI